MDDNATTLGGEGGQESLDASSQQATETKAQRRARERTERATTEADAATTSEPSTDGDARTDDTGADSGEPEPASTYSPPDTPGDMEMEAEHIIRAARPLLGISPHLARGVLIGEDRLTVDAARQKVAAVHDREVT